MIYNMKDKIEITTEVQRVKLVVKLVTPSFEYVL